MKILEKTKLLELYSYGIESFVLNLQDYLKTDNKVSELKYHIGHKLAEIFSIITGYDGDKKLFLMRLKRNKKQTITYCLELLSIEWCEDIMVLMRTISNKRHTWKIVQDKKLEYSWDFIESIFN
jgi:DNA-directed RNA polymerase subunit L